MMIPGQMKSRVSRFGALTSGSLPNRRPLELEMIDIRPASMGRGQSNAFRRISHDSGTGEIVGGDSLNVNVYGAKAYHTSLP